MSGDDAFQNALKHALSPSAGSGASVDDPRRLGPIHPLLAPAIERMLVSTIYGEKDQDWFDDGRRYHKNDSVCEQRIRVGARPKPAWAAPGRLYSMFFELSELTHTAPVPNEVKKAAADAAARMPVPDASFVSLFPLTAVKAQSAMEAARIIAGYLAQAQAEGWNIGRVTALVDDWRNEYELTKADQKTVMRFDMRPALLTDSRLSLVALTLIAGTPKLEEVIKNYQSNASWPEAFAAAGLSLIDTSQTKPDALVSHSGKLSTNPAPAPEVQPSRDSSHWYYYERGQQKGPVSERQIVLLIQQGAINQNTVARSTDDPMREGGYWIKTGSSSLSVAGDDGGDV